MPSTQSNVVHFDTEGGTSGTVSCHFESATVINDTHTGLHVDFVFSMMMSSTFFIFLIKMHNKNEETHDKVQTEAVVNENNIFGFEPKKKLRKRHTRYFL